MKKNSFIILFFSYDGIVFQDHDDSNYGHHFTSLANIEGFPLATGGFMNDTNKAETYDYSTNTWTEVAEYPYHER